MGAGRCQRRWTVALRGHWQHIRHNRLVRRSWWSDGKPSCAFLPTSRDRSKAATISPPRIGATSIVATSTWAGPRRSRWMSGPNGARKLIFAIGKTGEAYLLDRDNLGGVGGALANARVTTNIAITSPAVWTPPTGYLSFCRAMARIVREVSPRTV